MKKLIVLIAIISIPALIMAGVTRFPGGLVVGTETEGAAATVTPGDTDIYVPGTLEVDGAVRLDGAITATSTLGLTGNLDVGGVIQAGSGNHNLTSAVGFIDGEKIDTDTIDDDSIDFSDVTGADLTLTDCGAITSSGLITGSSVAATNALTAGSLDVSGVIQAGSGNHNLTSSVGLIDGEKIDDDTIDDDSIDFADVTGADIALTDCGAIGSTRVTATNATYGVVVASSTSSSVNMQLGGAYAALPTTGFPEGSIIFFTTDKAVYVSTEAVAGAFSWVKVGAQ